MESVPLSASIPSYREQPNNLPLVLVHGLFDIPRVFDHLLRGLNGRREPLLLPALPLRFGIAPIQASAQRFAGHIEAAFGAREPIDLLGFSLGGFIARTRRFLSLGSPQHGTLTAPPWPRLPMAGIADLKLGSALLRHPAALDPVVEELLRP